VTDLALTDRLTEWLETEEVLAGALALGGYSDEMDVERRLLAVAEPAPAPGFAREESALARLAGLIQ
jgi:hypothetical protein